MTTAHAILTEAATIVTGPRQAQHGPARSTFTAVAALWTAYLKLRRNPAADITPVDVCHMMALLKLSRSQYGELNSDDHVDACGYLAIAGELST